MIGKSTPIQNQIINNESEVLMHKITLKSTSMTTVRYAVFALMLLMLNYAQAQKKSTDNLNINSLISPIDSSNIFIAS